MVADERRILLDDIVIKEMNKNDITYVQKLIKQLDYIYKSGHDISINAISNTFLEMEKNKNIYKNFIAVLNEKIIGFISAVFYKTFFHTGGTAFINELIIDENFRGKKIGEKLILTIIEIADNLNFNEIEVSTSFENKKAIQFYKKNGLIDESILLGKELNN